MKKILKWGIICFICLVIIGAMIGGGDDKSTTDTNDQSVETTSENADSANVKEENTNKPTISKVEFDTIQNGMTYEEVVSIIGSDGEVLSEAGEAGTDLHTVMYSYEGEGDLGANANFTFQGGKLQAKAQFGLK